MIPRGKYIGSRLAILRRTRSNTSSAFLPAAAGSIAVILAKCSSTKVRSHTQRRINRNDGRSIRNSDRWRAAQLPRPKGLRDGGLPSFASSMIFWATASRVGLTIPSVCRRRRLESDDQEMSRLWIELTALQISLRDTTGPDRFRVMVGARRWGRSDQQAKQRAPDTHCAAMVNVPQLHNAKTRRGVGRPRGSLQGLSAT